jgi:hypothetical protein
MASIHQLMEAFFHRKNVYLYFFVKNANLFDYIRWIKQIKTERMSVLGKKKWLKTPFIHAGGF